jgi:hypothetical protein
MQKNIVEPDMPQMTVRHVRISRWIPKDTDTHLEYLTLIAFPRQQWLHERAATLRYTYTYIACLVITYMQYVYCVVRGATL